jgi:hypothetical protein
LLRAYALDTGGKEWRIAERLKYRLLQCSNCDFTGDIQNTISLIAAHLARFLQQHCENEKHSR